VELHQHAIQRQGGCINYGSAFFKGDIHRILPFAGQPLFFLGARGQASIPLSRNFVFLHLLIRSVELLVEPE